MFSTFIINLTLIISDANDPDLKLPLTTEEEDIRSYLLSEGDLGEEILEQYLRPFWYQEPYKSVCLSSTRITR